ncbi:YicC/YloC family endoribonuclease [Thiohalorhabdus methylotrophus]|uniref:YicC/YloC family endoribonuclease n=1 Tax=Thiohalorhabdus methylotrophus TaxID=3242694 RepID=A0ABV4TT34_9GAMM
MIRSMTAFARSEADLGSQQAVWELRTVNHRYLEVNPRLPDGYRALETPVRERARGVLQRGKLDATLRLTENGGGGGRLRLDQELARSLADLGREAERELGTTGELSTAEIMKWPGVVVTATLDADEAQRRLREALDSALEGLVEARAREGQALSDALHERLDGVDAGLARIEERLPQVREAFRSRLEERLGELRERVDPDRLEQEVVMQVQRADVDEELDRLATHTAEVRRVLEEGGAVGRRLDFLMQEMNREANTIGSKSPDAAISQTVVDLKVLVEQLREQAQNIE